jgi:tetratricopeptide (TPR) repeat protein
MVMKRAEDEQTERLKAYDGKDYSEIIEFPVELVDRDGVVRRYSYEESLAVYHRRIQSAPWRYAEDDLIRAEIGHCTRRIDQIKRSYKARSNRGRPASSPNPRAALGEGYEMLRRHYLALLDQRRLKLHDELSLTVTLLQDDPSCRVYHVGFGGHGGHLLYVYPFDRLGDGDPRAAFESAQGAYRFPVAGAGVERLLFAEAGHEAGFLLAGTEECPDGLRDQGITIEAGSGDPLGFIADESQFWWLDGMAEDDEDDISDPDFEAGVAALRDGRNDHAVDCFRLAVERNPFHREAYLALLAVLDGVERYEEAELYGAMAGRNLPEDGLIRYRQGINLVRRGDFDGALVAFDDASRLAPTLYQPPYFAAHVMVARGYGLDGALGRLRAALAADEGEDHVRDSLRAVERCITLRRTVYLGAATLGALSVAGMVLGHLASVIGLGLSLGMAGVASPLSKGAARWLLRRSSKNLP